jgi:hypothetical protein
VEWADMRSIGKRLDELSRFLTGEDFDKFATRNQPLLKSVLDDYDPASSFKTFFQEQFFEVRNRIVHYGEINLKKPDAERCLSLASALLNLLGMMNTQRIRSMDEEHKKARESTLGTGS